MRALFIVSFLLVFTAPAIAQVSDDGDAIVSTLAPTVSAPAVSAPEATATAPPADADAGEGLTAPDPDVAGTAAPAADRPDDGTPDTLSPDDLAAQAALEKANADADAAYDAVFATLTKAQQAEMEALDAKFTETLRPIVQVFRVGAALEYCIVPPHALAPLTKQYIAAFKLYKDRQDDAQEELWAQHRDELKKITYIDKAVLEAHFQSQADVALQIAQKMVEEGGQKGDFDKTNCRAVKDVLNVAVAKTAEKFEKEALKAKTPPINGTATPAKP